MNLPDSEIFNKLKGRHHDVLSVQKIIDFDKVLDEYFKIDFSVEKNSKILDENFYTHENHLSEHALNTSYFDFYQILKEVPKGSVIADIGAGYARLALLNDYFGFNHKIISIEAVKERLFAAKSYCHNKHDFIVEDILSFDFKLPEADYYFLYIPTGKVFEKVLEGILEKAKEKKIHIIAIESHGNLIDLLWMNGSWLLESPKKLSTSLPRHKSSIYFFESKETSEILEFCEVLENDKKNRLIAFETLYLALSYYKKNNYKVLAKIKQVGLEAKEVLFELKESEFYINDEGKLFLETKFPPRLLKFSGDDEVIIKVI